MNAATRAANLCAKLTAIGYPLMGAELLLQISLGAWPLVQVWDDCIEALILIAVVDHDRQLVDALAYARALANQDVFGAVTVCYAIGPHAWVGEFEDGSSDASHVMQEAL